MGKRTYVRSGGAWVDITSGSAISRYANAPTSPTPLTGQVYYNTTDNNTYIYNGSTWDIVNSTASSSTPTSVASTAVVGTSVIASRQDHVHKGVTSITGTSNQVAASASDGAVTLSLPQSIGTSSTPSFSQATLTGGDSTTGTDTASLNLIGGNSRGGAGYHGFLDVKNTSAGATNPKKFFRLNSTGGLEVVDNAYSTVIMGLSNAGALSVPSITTSAATINGVLTGNQSGTLDINEGIILQRTTSLSIAQTTLPTTPSTASSTAITWSSAVKANTGMWTSGSAITAPLAGYYAINLNFQFGTGTAYAVGGYIFQGSTLRAHEEKQAGANTSADMLNVSAIIYCAANDSITARVAASTTAKSITVTSQNGYFSMLYLGAQS